MNQNRTGFSPLLALIVSTGVLFAVTVVVVAQDRPGGLATAAQTKDPPLSDTRLTVHTLLREDVFAGFLANDMKRFARGERNIDLLLDQRPGQKANLLAWKGGATLFRAVRALEDRHSEEFQRLYQQALDLFSQADKLKTGNEGVNAVTGGSYVLFADRLPKANRHSAWAQAYDAYSTLWKQQSGIIQALPVHLRGEVLGGLATSAARTGHRQELDQALEKMAVVLRDTPYESAVTKWKENPESASNPSLTCLSCHDAGRLDAKVSALDKK